MPWRSATIRSQVTCPEKCSARMLRQAQQAMQIGAISSDNPGIECRDDRLALRCFPTLPPIEGHLRAQVQVLNHDLLVALVARAGRRPRPNHDRRVNRQLVQLTAASTARLLALGALAVASRALVEGRPASVRCLVHAGRLLRRTRRQILQPRKLVPDGLMFSLQLRQSTAELLILCPQTPNLANQIANHANQIRLRETFQRIRDARCHP